MEFTQRNLAGKPYLETVTDLLHRIRLEGALAGLCEAADLQWWWREDHAMDPANQSFWYDADGQPIACLLRFEEGPGWHYEFYCLPSIQDIVDTVILPGIVDQISQVEAATAFTVREDDAVLQRVLEHVGFVPTDTVLVQTELVHDPPRTVLSPGFRLASRVEDADLPHHMIRRSGPEVDAKLRECSLYRPDLDLCIHAADGTVAAYVLFWMDDLTKVGLVEPVRTEEAYFRKGLARHLIGEGVARLRALGAESIRVSYEAGNDAAANLYHALGFVDRFRRIDYRRDPGQAS